MSRKITIIDDQKLVIPGEGEFTNKKGNLTPEVYDRLVTLYPKIIKRSVKIEEENGQTKQKS
jgi:hypothetical protein